MITLGQTLNNTYEITEQLGSGSGGIIFKAYHKRMKKFVAIKLIKDEIKGGISNRSEVDVLKNLKNDYLPQVLDFVEDGDEVYTVMEFIEGKNFKQLTEAGEVFSEKRARKYAIQLCEAAEYLHGNVPPIIHSDIKPANIMLTPKDNICLIDFNISMMSTNGIAASKGGSKGFAAPEQFRRVINAPAEIDEFHEKTRFIDDETEKLYDESTPETSSSHKTASKVKTKNASMAYIDIRTDVYGIGASLYYILTGRVPLDGKPDFRGIRCSSLIREIISKAMDPDPQKRFKNASDMKRALKKRVSVRPFAIAGAAVVGAFGVAAGITAVSEMLSGRAEVLSADGETSVTTAETAAVSETTGETTEFTETTADISVTTEVTSENDISEEKPDQMTLSKKTLQNKQVKYFSHRNDSYIKEAAEIFADEYGGTVKQIYTSYSDRYTDLLTYILGGEGIDLADIDEDMMPEAVISGMAVPVDEYIGNDSVWDGVRGVMDNYNFYGSSYAFVTSVLPQNILIYNKQTIEKYALDDPMQLYQSGKWNWDSFGEMLSAFCNEDEEKYGLDSWYYDQALFYSSGAKMTRLENGGIAANHDDPLVKKSWDYLNGLYYNGAFLDKSHFEWSDQPQFIGSGNELFYVYTTDSFLFELKNGKLPFETANEYLGIAPVPSPEGSKPYQQAMVNGFMLCKNAGNPEGAAAFAECMRYSSVNSDREIEKLFGEYGLTGEHISAYSEIVRLARENPVVDLTKGVSIDVRNIVFSNVGIYGAADGTTHEYYASDAGKVINELTKKANEQLKAAVMSEKPSDEDNEEDTEENGYITIKGERYSTSLTELDLSDKDLTNEDIKELYKMKKLTILDLSFNNISDISTLSGLSNLISLVLNENQISDIGALSGLTNLEFLCLGNNQISDISALSELTNLNLLEFSDNQISDISALSGLTNLELLRLGNNQISDINALSGLNNLTDLSLIQNQISDISVLSGLTNLTNLYLDFNKISESDIEALKKSLPNCEIHG